MCFSKKRKNILLPAALIALALCVTNVARAQKVTEVDANQEGKAIAVTYNLDEKADISLFLTYDGGKTKIAVPRDYTSGDIGKKVSPGSEKKILWRVLDQYPDRNFQSSGLSFIVNGKPCMRFFAMADAGYSIDSGFITGLTVGQLGLIGWYVKGMTTLSAAKPTIYECDIHGYIDGILPAYSGKSNKSEAYGVAGMTIRMGAPVYLKLGAGYGAKTCEWETTDGKWIKNAGLSSNGLAIDAGVIGKINNIALSAGATYLGKNVDLYIGVGYVF